MDLINDQQAHFLDVGTVLPVTGDAIPLLGGTNDDVSGQQGPQIWRVVTRYGRLLALQHNELPARFASMFTSCSAIMVNHTQAQDFAIAKGTADWSSAKGGLKWEKEYMAWADRGRGSRSSSSVWGGCLSGRIRFLKDTVRKASAPSQESATALHMQ
ncbi:MAG: hypothetical protein FRX49_06061 [Trebouxia sp. A1-2]|nr:MAG: hypothetical protein FRX49_06061 [Trebouxia sp. A1-2]